MKNLLYNAEAPILSLVGKSFAWEPGSHALITLAGSLESLEGAVLT